jgi:hypothetical protein
MNPKRMTVLLLVALIGTTPGLAADTAAKPRMSEAAEMFWAIFTGKMGPGEAWWHPSQTRYDWNWLASQYDRNKDKAVTRDELPAAGPLFQRLDRNGDGAITAEEFDWSERSPIARQEMIPTFWLRMYDANGNGRLSEEEWQAVFKRAAKGKDHLTIEDLREAFPTSPPRRGGGGGGGGGTPAGRPSIAGNQPKSGPETLILLKGLLEGEIGSFQEGPDLNAAAPDFTLKTPDQKQTLSLAEFRGKKPVVLIFGSFT